MLRSYNNYYSSTQHIIHTNSQYHPPPLLSPLHLYLQILCKYSCQHLHILHPTPKQNSRILGFERCCQKDLSRAAMLSQTSSRWGDVSYLPMSCILLVSGHQESAKHSLPSQRDFALLPYLRLWTEEPEWMQDPATVPSMKMHVKEIDTIHDIWQSFTTWYIAVGCRVVERHPEWYELKVCKGTKDGWIFVRWWTCLDINEITTSNSK